jgi:hypothetical protein
VINTVGIEEGGKGRGERVLDKLRTDHLKTEEKKLLRDRLSSTNPVKHAINLEPGTIPINTRTYRLPEKRG